MELMKTLKGLRLNMVYNPYVSKNDKNRIDFV